MFLNQTVKESKPFWSLLDMLKRSQIMILKPSFYEAIFLCRAEFHHCYQDFKDFFSKYILIEIDKYFLNVILVNYKFSLFLIRNINQCNV